MVSKKEIEKQLKQLKFNSHSWGRAEAQELHNVILEDEEIYELVNGMYEGGFALLIATNIRVLLIDKKPLNFLTVEDLRFDMITEIDYSHRVFGAHINIAAGSKNLKFTSYNQPRLRKLITHVQHCMAESKKKQSSHAEDQNSHLEQINQQLQAYLIAQHQQQEEMRQQLQTGSSDSSQQTDTPATAIQPIKPSPELSDYLLAQNLLRQYREQQANPIAQVKVSPAATPPAPAAPQTFFNSSGSDNSIDGLKAAAEAEIFGKNVAAAPAQMSAQPASQPTQTPVSNDALDYSRNPQRLAITPLSFKGIEINPLRIAYAKLPLALRNRKFGRPSFHAHSQVLPTQPVMPTTAPTPLPAN
jgi:hypothetical protein